MTLICLSVNLRKPYKFSALFLVHWTDILHVLIWQYIVAGVNSGTHKSTYNEGKPVYERNS